MRKIKDITIDEIKLGKNWKLISQEDFDLPMEEWRVEEKSTFKANDEIAYSIISVTENGDVFAGLQIKEVQYSDYGGDFCRYENGKWSQVGLVSNPNALITEDFVANPLDIDPSFNGDGQEDFRKWNRDNFKKWIDKLTD